jgi:hypothetical protein
MTDTTGVNFTPFRDEEMAEAAYYFLSIDDPELVGVYRATLPQEATEEERARKLLDLARHAYRTDPDHTKRFPNLNDKAIVVCAAMWGFVATMVSEDALLALL